MRNRLALGAVTLMLTGCALYPYTEAPIATNFHTTTQLKVQAGQHWQFIANDMADNLIASLLKGSTCVAPSGNCPALYVSQTMPQSAFGRAFHSQLISRLVNKGMKVASEAPGAVTITVEAQTVKFSPDRLQYKGAGNLTMLTTGLWAAHDISVNHSAGGAVVLGGAVLGDVANWYDSEYPKGRTPQLELILTTSASRAGQFLARTTNVYYLADSDATLYCWKPEACANNMNGYYSSTGTNGLRVVGDCGSSYCTTGGSK